MTVIANLPRTSALSGAFIAAHVITDQLTSLPVGHGAVDMPERGLIGSDIGKLFVGAASQFVCPATESPPRL